MKEFKQFILRGNVIDLAVGVIIGGAFGKVITSLVEDLITPLLGLVRLPDFKEASLPVGEASLRYGTFLNSVIYFLVISAVIFFLFIKPVNKLMARRKTEPDVESNTRPCPQCLSSIPLAASRCAFCTAKVAAAA